MDLEGGGGGFPWQVGVGTLFKSTPQYHCMLIRGKYIFISGATFHIPLPLNLQYWTSFYKHSLLEFWGPLFWFSKAFYAFRGWNRSKPPCLFPPHVNTDKVAYSLQCVSIYGSHVACKSMECKLLCINVASNNGSPNCSGLPVYCQHYNPLRIRRCSIL